MVMKANNEVENMNKRELFFFCSYQNNLFLQGQKSYIDLSKTN
jgi:hypothetical protein